MTVILNAANQFRPLNDEQKIAMGYSLIIADISFYHPEKTWLICGNTYTQQFYDLVPELPELNDLLKKCSAAGLRIETVKVATRKGAARLAAVDGHFQLH